MSSMSSNVYDVAELEATFPQSTWIWIECKFSPHYSRPSFCVHSSTWRICLIQEWHSGDSASNEEQIAADALQKVQPLRQSQLTLRRTKSSTGAGMRLLRNPCQVDDCYSNMGTLLNLTYYNDNGGVKLHPAVMNDFNELIDLTAWIQIFRTKHHSLFHSE